MNFFAPIILARGLIEELEAASGTVVNLSSIAGSRVHPFAGSAYATSKAALAALIRDADCRHSDAAARTAQEVAKAIYFLCIEQSSYINGAELSIDGGQQV